MPCAECPVCDVRKHHPWRSCRRASITIPFPSALPSPPTSSSSSLLSHPSHPSLCYLTRLFHLSALHFDRSQGPLLLLPRALVARGGGIFLLQTRTLRSRWEVTGQGLPWVRVELGLEQGARGAQQWLLREESHPQRPAGASWQAEWLVSQCDRMSGSWAPRRADSTGTAGGPSAQGAAPQQGEGLRERARGGNSCPGRAGLPELRWRDRLGSHSQEGK